MTRIAEALSVLDGRTRAGVSSGDDVACRQFAGSCVAPGSVLAGTGNATAFTLRPTANNERK